MEASFRQQHAEEEESLADFLLARERRTRFRRVFFEMAVLVAFVITFFFVSTSINNTAMAFESTAGVRDLLTNTEPDGGGDDDGRRRRRSRKLQVDDKGSGRSREGGRRRGGRRGRRLRAAGGGGDESESSYFDGLLNKDDVWTYLGDALGVALFGEEPLDLTGCRAGKGAEGSACAQRSNYLLQSNRLLGAIRISQVRVNSGSSDGEEIALTLQSDGGCSVPAIYSAASNVVTRAGEPSTIIIPACYPSHESLGATWSVAAFGGPPNGTAPPFEVTSAKQTRASQTSLSMDYGDVVFEQDIPSHINLTEWRARMAELRELDFIDENTRFVTVAMNAYNVATDLFLCIELKFEFAHSGGVWTSAQIRTLSYNRHLHIFFGSNSATDTAESISMVIAELLFLTFLLANFAMQVSQLREHGWAYLLVAYNWLSFANVVLFVVIEARRFTLIQAMIHAIEIDHARDPEKFVPLYPLANNAFDTQCLLSVNTLLLLPLIFKFLGLSPRLDLLAATLVLAAGEMFWFVLLFATLLSSYVVAFYLCFGMDVAAFGGALPTLYTLLSLLLGQFNFDKLSDYNPYVGPPLYWTYIVLLFFFVLSSFVAIIEEAFGQAKEEAKTKYDELANALSAKMRDRMRDLQVRGRKFQKYAQKTRSTNVSGSKFMLRARESNGAHARHTRLAQMGDAVRGVLRRHNVPIAGRGPEEERLRRAAWQELHNRRKATHQLMARLHRARQQQCELLSKVVQQKQQQMAQLEELSTQLWNCWQLVADAQNPAAKNGAGDAAAGGEASPRS